MTKSAFDGLKLTPAPTPVVPVDQRLFAPTPAAAETKSQVPTPVVPISTQPAAPSALPHKVTDREPPERAIPIEAARSERPLTEPGAKTVSRFDINDTPVRKATFLVTEAEFDRLEDFKLELRRRFDLNATKNDIARAAFHHLYEDYSREPLKSAIVRHLRSKKA